MQLSLADCFRVHLNTYNLAFGLLAYISSDAVLYQQVSAGTSAAVSNGGTLNMDHPLRECPMLRAAWPECLRLYTVSSMDRNVGMPTKIGGKTVNIGDQILAPFHFFHLQPKLFGEDAAQFHAE